MVERQHSTIKNVLLKVLDNPDQWLYTLQGVLFTYLVSRHLSTKDLPFYLMYNREPVLPVDLKDGLNSEPVNLSEPIDQDMFAVVFSTANLVRDRIHESAGGNIKKAQEKQKYNSDRRHLSFANVNVGNKVLNASG